MIKTVLIILDLIIMFMMLGAIKDIPKELDLINNNLAQINQSMQEQNKIFGFNPNEVEER